MKSPLRITTVGLIAIALQGGLNWFAAPASGQQAGEPVLYLDPLDVNVRPVADDKNVAFDYPIVYVRTPRVDERQSRWTEVGHPRTMDPGGELVVLHPDGREQVLAPVEPHESITDPFVSFDGQWVFYAKLHDALNHKGADIFKVHVPTGKVVQLTDQEFTPNTGAADWSKTPRPAWGVYNMGPTPVPGGKVGFVSDRNGFKGTNTGYAPRALAFQLFVMDDDGANVECIGHLNLGMALHPVILKDGRIMFSSLESQGLRSHHLWGIWAIHPDGTNWSPLVSAFDRGGGTTDSFHFQTQLSDESIIFESYYNLNNLGMGLYFKQAIRPPEGVPAFGPGYKEHPRNPLLRNSRHGNGKPNHLRFPFSHYGLEALTPFIQRADRPSPEAVLGQEDSPRVGKFTHPSGAPDNDMLTVWASGSVYGSMSGRYGPAKSVDSGIYLIKDGAPIEEPAQMLLIKNDPKYNEQWPRALVPYRRIYGIDEPPVLTPPAKNEKYAEQLPAAAPFGLVGTSSLYKRESYPYGVVPEGSVTATYAEETDRTGYRGHDGEGHWKVQGADAGLYENSEIHAIRIVILEPNTEREGGPQRGTLFYNHALERMRILGEIPVRKFAVAEAASFRGEAGSFSHDKSGQPVDPDGNPDTSFLARVPADVAWTFQTLDKHGMVLNSAQTWHQVRPGEVRHDCGGCHAHSQQPTKFELTAAADPDYQTFDLTQKTPLLVGKDRDESGHKWDAEDSTGLRYADGPKTVEFHRDVKPIFERSCVACHTHTAKEPAGNLVLDDETPLTISKSNKNQPVFGGTAENVPGTYVRLAGDPNGEFGHDPLHRHGWRAQGLLASRYVRLMQSRRSLLIWKVFGRRLDGFKNDDFPHLAVAGDVSSLQFKGEKVPYDGDIKNPAYLPQIAYTGGIMPPPEAVAGTYVGPEGMKIKVEPLSDEDRRTLVRWIDLGCPIDLDYDSARPDESYGWPLDDQRPTLTLAQPIAGTNARLDRILVGMHDYNTGLDPKSLEVVADFAVDGQEAGTNLAGRFKPASTGVWELALEKPITELAGGTLTVTIKDRQGNTTSIERTFSVRSGGH